MSLIRVCLLHIFRRRNSGVSLESHLTSCSKAFLPCLANSSIYFTFNAYFSCRNSMLYRGIDAMRSLLVLVIFLTLEWILGTMSVELWLSFLDTWFPCQSCRVPARIAIWCRGLTCIWSFTGLEVASQSFSFLLFATLGCWDLFLAVLALTSRLLTLNQTSWSLIWVDVLQMCSHYLCPIESSKRFVLSILCCPLGRGLLLSLQ